MDELAADSRAQLTVTADDGELRVALRGELDIASLPSVEPELDRLLSREPQPVQVDATDLAFLDSSGLVVLVRVANHFAPVQLRGARPAVRRVIEALGLADRLGLERS